MQESSFDAAVRVATEGMSFDIVRESGAFPPPDVLNDFLACGHDDVDCERDDSRSGCEGPDCEGCEDGALRWEPFALTEAEYAAFLAWWAARHPGARPDRLGLAGADFREWFGRAVDVIDAKGR